jgi:hypothetical protein
MTASQFHPRSRTGAKYEQLLSDMPRIAEAVNAFESEENQRMALSALLCEFGLPEESAVQSKPTEPGLSMVPPLDPTPPAEQGGEDASPGSSGGPFASGRRRNRKKATLRAKDINLYPEGMQSVRDFAAQKAPAGSHEMHAVAVYYLQEVLGLNAIEVGHVLAVFNECGWRVPSDPENAVSKTACMKKWLDTSDRKAIRLTFSGRNLIQHDLPRNARNSA